jgi:hypothetical protein
VPCRTTNGECINLFVAGNDIIGVSIAGQYGLVSISGMAAATKSVAGSATLFCKEVNSKAHLEDVRAAYVKETYSVRPGEYGYGAKGCVGVKGGGLWQ